jgi:hypothetical protein
VVILSLGKRLRIELKKGNYVTSVLTLYENLVIVAGLTNKKDKEFVNSLTGLKGFES